MRGWRYTGRIVIAVVSGWAKRKKIFRVQVFHDVCAKTNNKLPGFDSSQSATLFSSRFSLLQNQTLPFSTPPRTLKNKRNVRHLQILEHVYHWLVHTTLVSIKVKNAHRSKFSNLSNWKEEAWKNQGFNGIRWAFFTLIYNRSSNIWIISYILHITGFNRWWFAQFLHFGRLKRKSNHPIVSAACVTSTIYVTQEREQLRDHEMTAADKMFRVTWD